MTILDFLENNGIDYRRAGGDEVRINCPFCDDRRYHCWINLDKYAARCFRPQCEAHGSAYKFLRQFGKIGRGTFTRPKLNPFKAEPVAPEVKLPDGCHMVAPEDETMFGKKALEYLVNERGLTLEEIERWGIMYCKSDPYKGYIIFPAYDAQEDLIGWQGKRYMLAGAKNNNPAGSEGILYGLDQYEPGQPLILVEGPLDCIHVNRHVKSIGYGCLALMGHTLPAIKAATICYELAPTTVYIMLDPDANESEYSLGNALAALGATKIMLCQLGEVDPKAMASTGILEALEKAKEYTKEDAIRHGLRLFK